MKIKHVWYALAMLLLLYALDVLTFGITTPVISPTLNTFTDRLARAFISIAIAAGIIHFIEYQHD